MKTSLIFFAFLSSIIGCRSQELVLELFVQGLNDPIELTHAGDDRLFVVEQSGIIKIINQDGSVNATPFLNISNLVSNGGEQGLLGLAFPPDYQTSGRFYVNYTNLEGDTKIARYTVSSDPNVANPNGTILLSYDQPFSNHNGGTIKFGPDSYLWIASGDGGSGGDPNNNGQNKNSLLGKILRIDVSGDTYTSPPDNPFVGIDGADEVWSYGLRNPWKFSFDRNNDAIWIADVGQNEIEEINHRATTEQALNYGWRCYEGNDPYNTSGCVDAQFMTFPIATYSHSNGRCSITGGYIYRGSLYPALFGKYFFGDYCSQEIGWITPTGELAFVLNSGISITSFGEDVNGELYVVGSGKIYKIKDGQMGMTDETKNNLSVYPNPANTMIYVQSQKPYQYLHIYNMEGKLMKALNFTQEPINISELLPGVYTIKVFMENYTSSIQFLHK